MFAASGSVCTPYSIHHSVLHCTHITSFICRKTSFPSSLTSLPVVISVLLDLVIVVCPCTRFWAMNLEKAREMVWTLLNCSWFNFSVWKSGGQSRQWNKVAETQVSWKAFIIKTETSTQAIWDAQVDKNAEIEWPASLSTLVNGAQSYQTSPNVVSLPSTVSQTHRSVNVKCFLVQKCREIRLHVAAVV